MLPLFLLVSQALAGPVQLPILSASASPSSATMRERVVPGNNDAVFCAVPRSEQLFEVAFLEVAPTPLPVDRIFFTWLQGEVPDVPGLADARMRITGQADLASGERFGPSTYEIPLASFADRMAHLSIRYGDGQYGDTLRPGSNGLLTDYFIPGVFLKSGQWTFRIEGVLDDERWLFCLETSQWLEGDA